LDNSDNYYECIVKDYDYNTNSDYSCFCKYYGLNDKQWELIKNLAPAYEKCFPLYELSMEECVDLCAAVYGDCYQKCNEFNQLFEGTCLAKLADMPNFDVRKLIECANNCNQVTLSEVFGCDYYCKKELYEALIISPTKDEIMGNFLNLADSKPSVSSSSIYSNSNTRISRNYGEENIENNSSNIFNSTDTKSSEEKSPNVNISIRKTLTFSFTFPWPGPDSKSTEFSGISNFLTFTLILATLLLFIVFNIMSRLY
jgi:hypothetical protein